MNQPSLPPDLLRTYLLGTCTDEEKQRVEAWYERLDALPPGSSDALPLDERALFERVKAAINHQEPFGRPVVVRPLHQRSWFWAAAASVLILLGIGFGTRISSVVTTSLQSLQPEAASQIQVVNQQKRVVQQRLPDGTVVWLNPGATLSYPATFAADRRAVSFAGEGFFEVARDTSKPFLISSGQMRTQVLGTSFNVKAIERDDVYEVAVVTGRVAVSAPTLDGQMRTVVLSPRQQAVFAVKTNRLTANEVPTKVGEAESWQPVSLAFDDVTLRDVARRLEQQFGVSVSLSNPQLANCRLTVDFSQQRLAEILEVIDKLLGTQYQLEGNAITLTGDGCAPQ